MAQKWADICVWEHTLYVSDESQKVLKFNKSDYQGQGQNLWMWSSSSPSTDYESAANGSVTAWYGEKANYNYANKVCAIKKVCGHYTQVCNCFVCTCLYAIIFHIRGRYFRIFT